MRRQREIAEIIVNGLERAISRLNDEVTEQDIVLVEGKRDSVALRSAGFRGRIVTLNRYGGETALIDQAAKTNCVFLLLDLDNEGEEITGRLARKLWERGCKVNTSLRENLRRETIGRIRRIEEVSRWVPYLSQRVD